MRDFNKKRGAALWRALIGYAGLLLLVALAFFVVRAAWGMYDKFSLAMDARASAEKELQNVEERYARVSAATAALQSARGEEKELRARYGVARPGEGEIRVVREEGAESPFPAEHISLWRRVWEALFVW